MSESVRVLRLLELRKRYVDVREYRACLLLADEKLVSLPHCQNSACTVACVEADPALCQGFVFAKSVWKWRVGL